MGVGVGGGGRGGFHLLSFPRKPNEILYLI